MIRKAVYEDLDAVFEIEQLSFDEPWSRVSIEAEFYKDYADIYVYEDEGTVKGYIITWFLPPEAELVTIAVSSGNRRKGIGRKLLEYMIVHYGSNIKWHLEVNCKNDTAVNLYKSFGFEIAGIIKNYYGTDKHAYRMIRNNDIIKEYYNVD